MEQPRLTKEYLEKMLEESRVDEFEQKEYFDRLGIDDGVEDESSMSPAGVVPETSMHNRLSAMFDDINSGMDISTSNRGVNRRQIIGYSGHREHRMSIPLYDSDVDMLSDNSHSFPMVTDKVKHMLTYTLEDITEMVFNLCRTYGKSDNSHYQMIMRAVNSYLYDLQQYIMFGFKSRINRSEISFSVMLQIHLFTSFNGEITTLTKEIDLDRFSS